MNTVKQTIATSMLLAFGVAASAQEAGSDRIELQRAAIEALMSAPPERALPLARKVVTGDYDDDLKERALFVLSQIDDPEAQSLILDAARNGSGDMRYEAIRMIGIGGNRDSLAQLRDLYSTGDRDAREAVLEAYMIAGDEESVYTLAANAADQEEFDAAVEALAAMGATTKLRSLRDKAGDSEGWIEALAISGDKETIRELALDGSDTERQLQAIEALGMVGDNDSENTLIQIYRSASNDDIREAAMEGLLIAGNDGALIELYRESDDPAEKKELLETLVMMGSDEVWEVIDAALDGGL